MIADEFRLPLNQPAQAAVASEGRGNISPESARMWRYWATMSALNGQVTIGLDIFLDALNQIEQIKR